MLRYAAATFDAELLTAQRDDGLTVRFTRSERLILKQLVDNTKGADQETWFKQLVDGLASAVQTGAYDDGLQELKVIEKRVQSQAKGTSPLLPYVVYRRCWPSIPHRFSKPKGARLKPRFRKIGSKTCRTSSSNFPKVKTLLMR